ncbi:UDP-glucose 4-epimerase [Spinactinospora alkalitolerans]|uniref:UDP-glucose 4-epimerase n=1 Tax=Spinactinospora alkalitolerans TaxID=687207 RepID=A0A852TWR5_9ACTN|nr:NAD-dependent epimerase/dehydratase family protein [Spinactinospora alkalitolerans]NYE47312.1 UDP-glucose 4-epimerase [Spinactinospora alkalitolerans]
MTGGAGFIGSHLVDHLLGLGHRVVVLDDLSTGSPRNLEHLRHHPDLECVRGSVLDTACVRRVMAGCDTVFHLAAPVRASPAEHRPIETMRTNVTGTETVLEAAADGDRRVLFASSGEIYGRSHGKPLREDDDRVLGSPLSRRWCSAVTKGLGELLMDRYRREYGLRTVTVRLFGVTGPRQNGRCAPVIPVFVEQALRGGPLTVHGDGTQRRSFCSVRDIAPALVALVEQPRAHGRAVNLGGAEETTIADLARRVRALTDSGSGIVTVPHEAVHGPGYTDVHFRVPDVALARDLIGWAPTTALDGIITAVAETRAAETGLIGDGLIA